MIIEINFALFNLPYLFANNGMSQQVPYSLGQTEDNERKVF